MSPDASPGIENREAGHETSDWLRGGNRDRQTNRRNCQRTPMNDHFAAAGLGRLILAGSGPNLT